MRAIRVKTAKRRLAIWALYVATVLLGTLTGCVSDENSGDEDGDGWVICDDCEAEPEAPVEERPDDQEPLPGKVETCLPQAVQVAAEGVPELPDAMVVGQCSLEQQAIDRDADGEADRVTRWQRDGHVIEKTVEDRGRLWIRVTFELAEGDRIRRVLRRENHIYYGSGHIDQEWVFDAQGRLTSKLYQSWQNDDGIETLQYSQQVTQTFNDGRLVAKTETYGAGDSEQRRSYRWRYDSDRRLVESQVEHAPSGLTQRSVWTYENGRPASVERRINDVVTVRHQWDFHDDGAVAGHDVEYGLHGLAEQKAELDARAAVSVDSYQTSDPYTMYSAYGQSNNPWRTANARFDAERGCHTLPNTVGHGYPSDEEVYQLGWVQNEQSDDLDFASGYGGYGYLYGYAQQPWYGHAGAGTPWPSSAYSGVNGILSARLRYDTDGRMTDETLTFKPYAGGGEEAQMASMQVERRRSFGDAGMMEDHVRVVSGGVTRERSLRFEYDEGGEFIARALWQGGSKLAFQSWERDGAGRIVEHDVHISDAAHSVPMTLFNLFEREPTDPVHTATYERRFDDQARLTLAAAQLHRNGGERTQLDLVHGEHGLLEERRTFIYNGSQSSSRIVRDYDVAGRQTVEAHDYDDDGAIDTKTRYVYRDDRLVEVSVWRGSTIQTTSLTYSCQ